MANVATVSDSDFQAQVLQSEQPVVVDFWATWCGPCKMISPVVEDLAREYDGKAKFVKLDVDANPATAQAMGIMSMPTLLFFKGGRPVDRQVGYRPNIRTDLKQKLDAIL